MTRSHRPVPRPMEFRNDSNRLWRILAAVSFDEGFGAGCPRWTSSRGATIL